MDTALGKTHADKTARRSGGLDFANGDSLRIADWGPPPRNQINLSAENHRLGKQYNLLRVHGGTQ
jgi:hypothetical protein